MSTNPVQMYQVSGGENPENVVLRALMGNPNRHKPLAQHTPPTTLADEKKEASTMYTLETQHRPIPPRVLPKKEPHVYYIEPKVRQEPPISSPSITKEEVATPVTPPPVMYEQQPLFHTITGRPKNIEIEQPPIVYLESKVISQPVLYSVVGAKTFPTLEQPIVTYKTVPSPVLYSIAGRPRRPTVDMSITSLDTRTPTVDSTSMIDKSPTFYSLIGSPHQNIRTKESTEQSIPKQQLSPSLYSVVGHPPRMNVPIEKPIPKQQLSPSLYSIVGSPTLTSRATQVSTITTSPPLQPVKAIPTQASPVLYTIVGNTHVPAIVPKENRPPPPVKKQPNDIVLYQLVGAPRTPQSLPLPRKQEQQSPLTHPHRPVLYSLVGKPNSPTSENLATRTKPPAQKPSPPTSLLLRRASRSLETKPPREVTPEEIVSYTVIGNKRPVPKEPTIPKSQTVFIPLRDEERRTRPQPPPLKPQHRSAPDSSPEQPRKRHQVAEYDPLRLPDYRSPYAFHAQKPYREQRVITHPLPVTVSKRPERQPRPALHEPRYRVERRNPYEQPQSIERFPVKTNDDSRMWDYQQQPHTDGEQDTDDERPEPRTFRKQTRYRRRRPRTPWIPVW